MQLSIHITVDSASLQLIPLIEGAACGCNVVLSVIPQADGVRLLVVSSEDSVDTSASRLGVFLASIAPALQAASGIQKQQQLRTMPGSPNAESLSGIRISTSSGTTRVTGIPLDLNQPSVAPARPVVDPLPQPIPLQTPVPHQAAPAVVTPAIPEAPVAQVQVEQAPQAPLPPPVTDESTSKPTVPSGPRRPLLVAFVAEERGEVSQRTATILGSNAYDACVALKKMFPKVKIDHVEVIRDFAPSEN